MPKVSEIHIAAYGILVLVFQEGFLAEFFGLQESKTIESWIPLFLFTILCGLSMDYHGFLCPASESITTEQGTPLRQWHSEYGPPGV